MIHKKEGGRQGDQGLSRNDKQHKQNKGAAVTDPSWLNWRYLSQSIVSIVCIERPGGVVAAVGVVDGGEKAGQKKE